MKKVYSPHPHVKVYLICFVREIIRIKCVYGLSVEAGKKEHNTSFHRKLRIDLIYILTIFIFN